MTMEDVGQLRSTLGLDWSDYEKSLDAAEARLEKFEAKHADVMKRLASITMNEAQSAIQAGGGGGGGGLVQTFVRDVEGSVAPHTHEDSHRHDGGGSGSNRGGDASDKPQNKPPDYDPPKPPTRKSDGEEEASKFEKLASVLRQATGALAPLGIASEKAELGIAALELRAVALGVGVAVMGVAVGAAAEKFIDLGMEAEESSKTLEAWSGASQKNVKDVEEALTSLGGKFGITGEQNVQAYTGVAPVLQAYGGKPGEGKQGELPDPTELMKEADAVSTASNQNLSDVTRAIAESSATFNESYKKSGDMLLKTSELTGMPISELSDMYGRLRDTLGDAAPSMEGTSTLVYALGKAGLHGTRAMTTAETDIASMMGNTPQSREEMSKLGIPLTDQSGKRRSEDVVMPEVIESMDRLDDAGKRDAATMLVEAASAESFLRVINQGPEAWQSYTKAVEENSSAIDQAATKTDSAAAAFKKFKADISTQVQTKAGEFVESTGTAINDVQGKNGASKGEAAVGLGLGVGTAVAFGGMAALTLASGGLALPLIIGGGLLAGGIAGGGVIAQEERGQGPLSQGAQDPTLTDQQKNTEANNKLKEAEDDLKKKQDAVSTLKSLNSPGSGMKIGMAEEGVTSAQKKVDELRQKAESTAKDLSTPTSPGGTQKSDLDTIGLSNASWPGWPIEQGPPPISTVPLPVQSGGKVEPWQAPIPGGGSLLLGSVYKDEPDKALELLPKNIQDQLGKLNLPPLPGFPSIENRDAKQIPEVVMSAELAQKQAQGAEVTGNNDIAQNYRDMASAMNAGDTAGLGLAQSMLAINEAVQSTDLSKVTLGVNSMTNAMQSAVSAAQGMPGVAAAQQKLSEMQAAKQAGGPNAPSEVDISKQQGEVQTQQAGVQAEVSKQAPSLKIETLGAQEDSAAAAGQTRVAAAIKDVITAYQGESPAAQAAAEANLQVAESATTTAQSLQQLAAASIQSSQAGQLSALQGNPEVAAAQQKLAGLQAQQAKNPGSVDITTMTQAQNEIAQAQQAKSIVTQSQALGAQSVSSGGQGQLAAVQGSPEVAALYQQLAGLQAKQSRDPGSVNSTELADVQNRINQAQQSRQFTQATQDLGAQAITSGQEGQLAGIQGRPDVAAAYQRLSGLQQQQAVSPGSVDITDLKNAEIAVNQLGKATDILEASQSNAIQVSQLMAQAESEQAQGHQANAQAIMAEADALQNGNEVAFKAAQGKAGVIQTETGTQLQQQQMGAESRQSGYRAQADIIQGRGGIGALEQQLSEAQASPTPDASKIEDLSSKIADATSKLQNEEAAMAKLDNMTQLSDQMNISYASHQGDVAASMANTIQALADGDEALAQHDQAITQSLQLENQLAQVRAQSAQSVTATGLQADLLAAQGLPDQAAAARKLQATIADPNATQADITKAQGTLTNMGTQQQIDETKAKKGLDIGQSQTQEIMFTAQGLGLAAEAQRQYTAALEDGNPVAIQAAQALVGYAQSLQQLIQLQSRQRDTVIGAASGAIQTGEAQQQKHYDVMSMPQSVQDAMAPWLQGYDVASQKLQDLQVQLSKALSSGSPEAAESIQGLQDQISNTTATIQLMTTGLDATKQAALGLSLALQGALTQPTQEQNDNNVKIAKLNEQAVGLVASLGGKPLKPGTPEFKKFGEIGDEIGALSVANSQIEAHQGVNKAEAIAAAPAMTVAEQNRLAETQIPLIGKQAGPGAPQIPTINQADPGQAFMGAVQQSLPAVSKQAGEQFGQKALEVIAQGLGIKLNPGGTENKIGTGPGTGTGVGTPDQANQKGYGESLIDVTPALHHAGTGQNTIGTTMPTPMVDPYEYAMRLQQGVSTATQLQVPPTPEPPRISEKASGGDGQVVIPTTKPYGHWQGDESGSSNPSNQIQATGQSSAGGASIANGSTSGSMRVSVSVDGRSIGEAFAHEVFDGLNMHAGVSPG